MVGRRRYGYMGFCIRGMLGFAIWGVEELEWGSGCMVAQDLKIQASCVILYLVWMVWSCVSTTYVVRVICPDSDIDV